MKHKKSLLMLLSLPLLLSGIVSCDKASDTPNKPATDEVTDTTKPTEIPTETNTTTETPDVGSWDSEISGQMLDLFGEELPYIAMGEEATYYAYEISGTTILCLYDTSETSIVEKYGKILLANGYEFQEKDESQGFDIFVYQKGDLVIEVSYQPAGEGYDAGNVIQAYLDNGEIAELTEWPEELKGILTDNLGEELPFAPMDAGSLFYNYVESGDYLFITDTNTKNVLTDYGTKLETNGFTSLGTSTNDDGDTVYSYTKKRSDKEGYSIHVDYYYQELYSGNFILAYSEKDIVKKESEVWPETEIKAVTKEAIPSFAVSEGKYTYYYPETGIVISGTVSEDITETYEISLKNSGFFFDIDSDTYEIFAYNWIEDTYVEYDYDEDTKVFTVEIGPMEASYDSLEKTFPATAIKEYLGEGATEVPAFPVAEGNEYKLYSLEEGIYLEAIDKNDSIVEAYKAILREAGYTISEKDGEVTAISAKEDVKLTFASSDNLFSLVVAKYTAAVDGEFDFTNENLLEEEDPNCSIWSTKTITFKVEKGTSNTNVGNTSYFYNPLRVYGGQIITISTTEGTLKDCTFITSGTKYAQVIAEATITGGTAEANNGNSIKIICDENTTTLTIALNTQTRINNLTVTKA